ncbi:MAG: CinA family protein [Halobacteria archaeon]
MEEQIREVREITSRRGETVSVVQAGSGKLISALTAVEGISSIFDSGTSVYSYRSKLRYGVSRETLEEHGAVSSEVARELAMSARDVNGVDWGLSTSCVAGPEGGTEEKSVGTAYLGVSRKGEWDTGSSYTEVRKESYEGRRNEIQEMVARGSIELFLEKLRE